MKKVVVSILGALCIILLSGIIFLIYTKRQAPAPSTNTDAFTNTQASQHAATLDSPTDFTAAFYAWYIQNKSVNPNFPYITNTSDNLAPSLAGWLTPQFIANFSTTQDSIDGDPILESQDFESTWGSSLQIRVESQSASQADLVVTFPSDEAYPSGHQLSVSLLKINGAWKVNGTGFNY